MVNKSMSLSRLSKGFLLSLFLVFPILSLNVVNTSADTWNIEVLNSLPNFCCERNSRLIAVDTNNNPHVVFGDEHLHYAYNNGSRWYYELVDTVSDIRVFRYRF